MRDRKLEKLFERYSRTGDVAALGLVFEGAAPELLRVAASLVADLAEAEDLVQASFLTAIERAPRWDRTLRLMPWLLGILVNHAREARRAKQRERGELDVERAAPAESPSARIEGDELSASLRAALDALPERQRAVLRAFLVEGRGAVEIARDSGRAPGAVRMQIHRALERLRRALPAGVGFGLAFEAGTGRGLAAMRAEVVAHALRHAPAFPLASASLASSPLSLATIGALAVTQKLALSALALVAALAAGTLWIVSDAPQSSVLEGERVVVSDRAAEETERASSASSPERAAFVDAAERDDARVPERASNSKSFFERSLAGVRGRLVTHAREPVARVDVTLLELRPDMLSAPFDELARGEPPALEIETARGITEKDGSFVLRGARASGVHALGVDLGGPRATLVFVGAPLSTGADADLGEVVLDPTGVSSGRIVDERGEPLAGARVFAADLPDWFAEFGLVEIRAGSAYFVSSGPAEHSVVELPRWAHAWSERLPIPRALTDADGRFELHALAGSSALVVQLDGRPPAVLTNLRIAADARLDVGDVALARGRRIEGRVVGADGKPLAGVELRAGSLVEPELHATTLSPVVTSDARGSFAFDGLREGARVVLASRRSATSRWRIHGPLDASDVELALESPSSLRIHLRSQDDEPIDGARILLAPDGPFTVRGAPASLSPFGEPRVLAREARGVYVLGELEPGAYQVFAAADGRASERQTLQVAAGANEAVVVLEPARVLRVCAYDAASGNPLEHCIVSVQPGVERDAAFDAGETDAQGEIVLDRVPTDRDDELLLRVEHPGYALHRAPLAPDSERVEVALDAGGALEARLHRGGAPPAAPLLLEVRLRTVKAPDVLVYGTSDARGLVRVGKLVPGEYTYRAIERMPRQGGVDLLDDLDSLDDVASGGFRIERGETTLLDVALGSDPSGSRARLSGRLALDGRPLAGFELSLETSRGSFGARTDARGEFALDELPPGEATLTLTPTSELDEDELPRVPIGYMERITLVAGDERVVELDWRTQELELRVVEGVESSPVEGAVVRLRSSDARGGSVVVVGRTDAQGIARMAAPCAKYAVTVEQADRGVAERELEVAGGATQRVEIALDPGVPCAGVLTLAPGIDAPTDGPARIMFLDASGGRIRGAEVELTGGRAQFRVAGLAAGRYRATLNVASRTLQAGEVELGASGNVALELVFAPARAR